ncbi:hypothetical protein FSARC_4217 [Fusarium sarcochroum]|uniref:RING-type domain-containing protein n=1 Tax=Fusarium sarcochroum TaxID=1208366 RepID=A0A8H4XBK3_9HYPO|nr:hypothetical protein FSARC_4217 [Fusarium sarcochroum]
MPHVEGFWPTIKHAINNTISTSQPNEAIKPQCPICLEDLSVTTFPPVPNRPSTEPNVDPTLGEVLLCGHVLCQACRRASEASKRACPVCRAALECSRCGAHAKPFPIPKNGGAEVVPVTIPEGAVHEGRCPECTAKLEFLNGIDKGEWPEGLGDMEVGFVPFFYHIVGKLEEQKRQVSRLSVINAFATIVDEEYLTMISKRTIHTADTSRHLRAQNPWFEREPPAVAQPQLPATPILGARFRLPPAPRLIRQPHGGPLNLDGQAPAGGVQRSVLQNLRFPSRQPLGRGPTSAPATTSAEQNASVSAYGPQGQGQGQAAAQEREREQTILSIGGVDIVMYNPYAEDDNEENQFMLG